MKKNVFVAGMMMAANALAGFGAMNNAFYPPLRAEAASVQSADDAVKQLIADQNKAEQNALDYTGAGFTVVSSEMTCGAENGHSLEIGVAPTANKKDVLYLYVDKFQCHAVSEYSGMTPVQVDLFFSEKRVAESKVLEAAGKGYEIVSFQVLPGKGDVTKFKFGVVKSGKSQVTYYYADKNSCIADGAGVVSAATDTQNPIMNFIGRYGNGRAAMTVSAKGSDKAVINVTWGSSAFEHSEWTMSGRVTTIGDCVIVDYEDCFKETISYDAEGTPVKDVIEYNDGEGRLTFHFNNVIWDDGVEGIADGAVFTWCN